MRSAIWDFGCELVNTKKSGEKEERRGYKVVTMCGF